MSNVALDGKRKKSLKARLIDQKYLFLLMPENLQNPFRMSIHAISVANT